MAAFSQAQLQSRLNDGHFGGIAPQLDNDELEATQTQVLTRNWPIALHLLGHIYNDNLESARFLWKRVPDQLKNQTQELQAIFLLLQACWNRDYQGIWTALDAYSWGSDLQLMITALKEKQRQKALELLSRSYSTVSPSKAAGLLGLPETEVLTLAQKQGWTQDPSGMLKVSHKVDTDNDRAEVQHLEKLAQYMVHLETGAG